MNLYDYIYVDIDKVISVYSQLTGGVVELREIQYDSSRTAENKRAYDFRVFSHNAGGVSSEGHAETETIKPYHALLQEMEHKLAASGHFLDLSEVSDDFSLSDARIRSSIKNSLCIKCKGQAVIEDYERIKGVAQAFPRIADFINRSARNNLQDSDEYQKTQKTIEDLESHGGSKSEKSAARRKARKMRDQLNSLVSSSSAIDPVEKWVLDGIREWIDTFLPGIINIRLYPPFADPNEHIIGHLESTKFTASNTTNFHFTYGSVPTEQLTLLGIVTSVPEKALSAFDPLKEFEKEALRDFESIENALRGLFRGFDGLESMIRTIRFPRILVHPMLVYRETTPNQESTTSRKKHP